MSINYHIWNYFVSSGRLVEYRNEPLSPSTYLGIHQRVIHREFGDECYFSIIDQLAEDLFKSEKESILAKKIRDLSWDETSFEDFIKDKLPLGRMTTVLNRYTRERGVDSERIGQETIWHLDCNKFAVDVRFLNPSKTYGIRYTVMVYHKNDKKTIDNLKFRFFSEYLWGLSLGWWDFILKEEELIGSLDSLMKNCKCLCEALDSYE